MLISAMYLAIRLVLPLLSVVPLFSAEPIEARFTGGVGRYVIDAGDAGYISLSASVRTYVSQRWSVEPGFSMTRGNPYREYSVSCNFIKDFGGLGSRVRDAGSRVKPYGLIALAYTRSSGSNPALGNLHQYPTIGAGMGVRIYLSDRIFVAPEVRLNLSLPSAEVTGSIGFVLRKSR
jgi:hypothetical protein